MVFERGSMKSETFSLSYTSNPSNHRTVNDIQLSETHQTFSQRENDFIKSKRTEDTGANDPLCPMLPSVKRNKDNNVEMFLYKNSMSNTSKPGIEQTKRKIGFEGKFL